MTGYVSWDIMLVYADGDADVLHNAAFTDRSGTIYADVWDARKDCVKSVKVPMRPVWYAWDVAKAIARETASARLRAIEADPGDAVRAYIEKSDEWKPENIEDGEYSPAY